MTNNLKESLRLSTLFSQTSDEQLEDVIDAASVKHVGRGEIIFYEADPAHAFFIVTSGKIKIFKLSADGKEQILRIVPVGGSFAEAAMFDGVSYPASAEALEESELVMINRDPFAAALARNPSLSLNLLGHLSKLLRRLTRLVEGLSLTDVTSRLAHYLVEQLDEENEAEQFVLHLAERKSVLASQLGTIPETFSRSLAKLTKDGIIEVHGSDITILDPDRLRELAGE